MADSEPLLSLDGDPVAAEALLRDVFGIDLEGKRLGRRAGGTVAGSGRSLGLGVREKAQAEGVCLP